MINVLLCPPRHLPPLLLLTHLFLDLICIVSSVRMCADAECSASAHIIASTLNIMTLFLNDKLTIRFLIEMSDMLEL